MYKTGMTEFLCSIGAKDLVGAEIGVKYGGNALCMLKYLDIKRLYLVDHYSSYVEKGVCYDYGYCYDVAVRRLKKYKDVVCFVLKDLRDAVDDIKDSLDFVWYDAHGDYDMVMFFLEHYYPLVKLGGVIGGKRFNSNWFDFCRAVIDFVDKNGFVLHGCNSGDWWIVKV